MLFRTHLVFGIFLYLVLLQFIPEPWFLLIGVLIGTCIVDLDSPKSTAGNYFLFRPIQFFIKHRGIVHSLFFGFLVMILIAIFQVSVAFGFIVGFLGHLFLDSFTKRRVAILWPLSRARFGLGLIRSGGLVEMILFVLLFFTDLAILVYLLL